MFKYRVDMDPCSLLFRGSAKLEYTYHHAVELLFPEEKNLRGQRYSSSFSHAQTHRKLNLLLLTLPVYERPKYIIGLVFRKCFSLHNPYKYPDVEFYH